MSKLSELIARLCPDGVEYKKLSAIGTLTRGKRFTKRDFVHSGIPAIHYGELYTHYSISTTLAKTYISDEIGVKMRFAQPNDVIIVGAGETVEDIGIGVAWLGGEAVAVHDACYILQHNLNPKYISYYLRTPQYHEQIKRYVSTGKISSISAEGIGKATIPVPPLEVQAEIVRILDNFAELTTELTEKLNAELIARKKQYEYYRNLLLNFDDAECPRGRYNNRRVAVRWMKLGEIGKVSMCKRILKHETNTTNDVPFYKIGTFGKEANAFISKELFETYKATYPYPQKGDILISAAGTIGRTVIFDGEPAYFQDSNIVWIANDENKVLNKFLYYVYQKQPWRASLGGTIARLYNDDIERTKIPVPPLSEQRRIVAILGRFDALCHDISAGLPAEIAARKKQYEYYRDKLLTFEEKTA